MAKKRFVLTFLLLIIFVFSSCNNVIEYDFDNTLESKITLFDYESPGNSANQRNKPSDRPTEANESLGYKIENDLFIFNQNKYHIIAVDGGDLSGERQPNVAVDVGFGDRVYWALTNEYGQLIIVLADRIILQDDNTEPVNKNGRYYDDEAKVQGTESPYYDSGHVIADSLGGVSNSYNITPQNSMLNRHGDQAYMEKIIRDAGGCENFIAIITYPDTLTHIPSHYHYEYEINGEKIVEDFDNLNPDEVNAIINQDSSFIEASELLRIDKNNDGIVTIKEAKEAGYSMPIYSDFWLYKYMIDGDGDGMVGE